MTSKTRLLFVDDEEAVRFFFREGLMNEALEIETASDGAGALRKLKAFRADIVVTDARMPNMDGLLLLKEIKMRYPDIFVVIASGYGTIEDAVNAMKAGAYDYILKPFDFDEIRRVIEKITGHKNILQKRLFLGNDQKKCSGFKNIIGQDAMIFCKGRKIIPADLPEKSWSASHTNNFDCTLSSSSLPLAEAAIIRKVLEKTNWNLKRSAEDLDIARGTLYSKMKKYGIEKAC
jgi:DNA-binding NtrC family response regulator